MDFNLTLIGQTIAMIVFVWFCMKYIWPPLIGAIEERQTKIADGLAASDKAEKAMAQAQHESEDIIRDARSQAQEIIDQAGSRKNEMIEEAKQAAAAEGERMLAAARAEIEQETNSAREQLRREVAGIAVAGASRLLEKEIDANSHAQLLDKLVAEL
ncbi:MAG: F0F1 ATP synthase subunit B [Pseudomonadota bacterium]